MDTIRSALSKTLLALAAAAVLTLPTVALAADDDDRMDDAWADAIGDQEGILTDKQFAMLKNLAFQAAVTKSCDGYAIDPAKMTKGISEITSAPPNDDMTEEQALEWHSAVLIRFGTTYGLFLAEGNAGAEDFCASAAELKNDKDVANVWQ
jgi:hypothetical protein